MAATVPPTATATLTAFVFVRRYHIVSTKITHNEDDSKQKPTLKLVQSRLHVRIKDAYLRRDFFTETGHLGSKIFVEVHHL